MRALLEPLREIADEIIVAADARADPAHLGHYAAVADRVVRFERGPRHSALSWLHGLCSGDWILLLAGDEVVSGELLAALPELMTRRDAQQVSFTLRWLWPDPGRWLSSAPWHPSFQVRLMRNDATLRFRGVQHELALPVSPSRFCDLPIWHLSLLAGDVQARRDKVATNEAARPGLTAAGGGELNARFYLPEDRDDLVLREVPAADRAAIERVWHATGAPLPVPEVPLARREEIEPRWALRAVPADAPLDAELSLLEALPLRLPPGHTQSVHVRVRNLGPERWSWGHDAQPPFRVGYGWAGDAEHPEQRAALPHDVVGGDETIVPLAITAPLEPGEHTLVIDMVLEHVRWFGRALRVPVLVVG